MDRFFIENKKMKYIKNNNEILPMTKIVRGRAIRFIVVHYTGGFSSEPGVAEQVNQIFLSGNSFGTADFIVDDDTIVQYNPDLLHRYTYHCGKDSRYKDMNKFLNICTNLNSVGIEMCSSNKSGEITFPGDPNYYFTEATQELTTVLIKVLMDVFDIPKTNVIRHYDVNKKICPGVRGWYGNEADSGEWIKFLERL